MAEAAAVESLSQVPEFAGVDICQALSSVTVEVVEPSGCVSPYGWHPRGSGCVAGLTDCSWGRLTIGGDDWAGNSLTHETAHWLLCGKDSGHHEWVERGIYPAIDRAALTFVQRAGTVSP